MRRLLVGLAAAAALTLPSVLAPAASHAGPLGPGCTRDHGTVTCTTTRSTGNAVHTTSTSQHGNFNRGTQDTNTQTRCNGSQRKC
jgi:hypothetical protein